MKKVVTIMMLAAAVVSCKTSEANYRAAYEKTISARSEDGCDAYAPSTRELASTVVISGNDTIPVKIEYLSILPEKNGSYADLKAYSVVVGQFKQKFNALSLRDRVVAAGYPDAFVVETAEPYYYIVAQTFSSAKDAADAMAKIKETAPVAMREPLPFILHDTRK